MDEKLPYGIFRTKEQMEACLTAKAKHKQRLETDPEYRERCEKSEDYLLKLFPPHSDED